MIKNLIEKIILKEDAYSDRKILLLAIDTWEKLTKNIENNVKNKKYVYEDSELLSTWIDTDFGGVSLSFTFDVDGKEGYGNYQPSLFKKDGGIDFININLGNIFDLTDKIKYVKTNHDIYETPVLKTDLFLKLIKSFGAQRTFIHEFTHFYDNNVNYSIVDNNCKNKLYGNSEYYNDVQEKNAFYMAWLIKIINETYHKYSKSMKYLSPEQRLNFLIEEWKDNEEFMYYYNKLNDKSKKRFISRLYSYFSTDFYK